MFSEEVLQHKHSHYINLYGHFLASYKHYRPKNSLQIQTHSYISIFPWRYRNKENCLNKANFEFSCTTFFLLGKINTRTFLQYIEQMENACPFPLKYSVFVSVFFFGTYFFLTAKITFSSVVLKTLLNNNTFLVTTNIE